MKKLSPKFYVIFSLYIVVLAITTFFITNILFSVVSNYEAITNVILAGGPLLFFGLILECVAIYFYRNIVKHIHDDLSKKQISLMVAIFGTCGMITSICCGTFVYHSFFASYIFTAYPLIMLIANAVFTAVSVQNFVFYTRKMKQTKEVIIRKTTFKEVIRTIGVIFLLIYSLDRLGAFFLTPVFYSRNNGYMALPYYLQLSVPFALVASFLIYRDILKGKARDKFGTISTIVILIVSILTTAYTGIMSRYTYPYFVQTVSSIQHFERLITFPIDYVVMVIITCVLQVLNLLDHFVKYIKSTRVAK